MAKHEADGVQLPVIDDAPKNGVFSDGEDVIRSLAETDYAPDWLPDNQDRVDGEVISE